MLAHAKGQVWGEEFCGCTNYVMVCKYARK